MNLNSLIIAADASRARLFRTAQTNLAQTPVELLEVETMERELAKPRRLSSSEASSVGRPCVRAEGCCGACDGATPPHGDDELRAYARRIAERAAHFARYHFCNPVIVSATHEVSSSLLVELEDKLPHVYVRSVSGEVASLPAPELLDALRKREAFSAVHYPPHP